MHLQNKHAQELLELESANPPRKPIISQEAKDRRAQKRLLKAGLAAAQHIYTTNADGTIQVDSGIQFVTDPSVSLTSIEEDINIGQPLRVMIKNPSNASNMNQNLAFLMSDDISTHHNVMEGKSAILDAIAEFVIMDLQLPEVVEGRGFQKLVATLRSPCEIPSKNKLEEDILPKIYENYKDSILHNLSLLNTEIGLAVEEWKTNTEESYVTFSVYYQNPGEVSLDFKVLSTIHAPNDWEEVQWGIALDTLFETWNLKVERITAVVTATARTELLNALKARKLSYVPCLLFILQLCATACFGDPYVVNILSKCRTVIGVILGHPNGCAAMVEQERILQVC